ncbi:helix-turn-helix domain-containing protein [Asticcacaulis sp. W401b]|uniref:helix-turn-helix domain-containing protein n=1 Tax=Asticcacaulis sp. W401b TaxID=3388666 RepID=UPI00397060A8
MVKLDGMNVYHLLGWRVKQVRIKLGLTQEELAARHGKVTQGYVSEFENGKINATLEIINGFSLALDTPLSELFIVTGVPDAILNSKIRTKF